MKRSAISENELKILEDAIIEYGRVITFSQLSSLFNKEVEYTRKRVSRLVEQGWLTRVKKGLFVISDISTRGTLAIAPEAVVNLIEEHAYISFESALQHHGLFDQLLTNINAISLKKHRTVEVGNYTYRFINSQEKYYYGWSLYEMDHQQVKIASIEKALVDSIQFHRTLYVADLVLEKLLDHQSEIDQEKLDAYILRSNLTVRRIFGFLKDCAGLDTSAIISSVENKKSVSSLSISKNDLYDHTWKLYYDQHFAKYKQ